MKIIVDTNIFASALILQEKPFWDVLKEHEVFAPAFLFIELGNVFDQYIKNRGYPTADALLNIALAQRILTDELSWNANVELIFRMTIKHRLSFYDAIYLALAIDHKYPLYTLDKKLAGAAKKENVLFEIKSDN